VAVASYLDRKGSGARRREILTPEGIPIQFTLASIGERTTALVIDILLVMVVVAAVAIVASIASAGKDDWIGALVLLLVTLTRHFYFAFFELRGHGATLGKRIARVRVIDARGGSLEASAVLARNLTRELELWMPLTFLLAMPLVWPDAPAWVWVVMTAWLVVLALFPVFNKDNLRVGDLVGGTIVVAEPRVQLRADLADARASAAKQLSSVMQQQVTIAAKGPTYTFTEAQLEVYGIYELQVLEGLLRGEAAADPAAVSTVADKIRAKIQYSERVPMGQDETFLADFYTALRAHLEKRLLFGKRREDKFDRKT
jgi:uncharacterized RDD family membrane protein YckC